MSEQPTKTRVLFVCNQNKVRSLTAEHLYRVRSDLDVKSAGTATFAKNQLTEALMKWADKVFIFDEMQTEAIERKFGKGAYDEKIVRLDLPDTFEYKSERLVIRLISKLEPYLGRPNSKNGIPKSSSKKGRSRIKGAVPVTHQQSDSLISQLLTAIGVSSRKGKDLKR